MINCGNLLRIVLVVVVLKVTSGLQDKLTSCCTKVSSNEITEPILKYEVQKPGGPCVIAVIFYTKTGHYCSQLNAPWVLKKIKELRRAKAQSGTTPVVSSSSSSVPLLSIISSTTSSPSASTLVSSSTPPSSSFTSPSSTRETSSTSNNE